MDLVSMQKSSSALTDNLSCTNVKEWRHRPGNVSQRRVVAFEMKRRRTCRALDQFTLFTTHCTDVLVLNVVSRVLVLHNHNHQVFNTTRHTLTVSSHHTLDQFTLFTTHCTDVLVLNVVSRVLVLHHHKHQAFNTTRHIHWVT